LKAWHEIARTARAVRNAIHSLRARKTPSAADLKTIAAASFGFGPAGDQRRNLAGRDAEPEEDEDLAPALKRRGYWGMVADLLNDWLVSAPVRFCCEVKELNPIDVTNTKLPRPLEVDFVIGYGVGVFPVIAAQLVAELSVDLVEEPVICSGCRLPRTPSRGSRRYCLPCRRQKVPDRDAHTAKRQRDRQRKQPTDVFTRPPHGGQPSQ
jgi:hypothetical protein